MPTVQRLLAPLVQVRQEEIGTLLLMFCYSFLAMTAYNIVKPLAGGMFIAEFGAQNLPFMILVAGPRPAEPGDVTGLFEALAGQDGDAS